MRGRVSYMSFSLVRRGARKGSLGDGAYWPRSPSSVVKVELRPDRNALWLLRQRSSHRRSAEAMCPRSCTGRAEADSLALITAQYFVASPGIVSKLTAQIFEEFHQESLRFKGSDQEFRFRIRTRRLRAALGVTTTTTGN